MYDFGINVLLNPSSFIGPANQVISVLNQLQSAVAKFGTGTSGSGRGLESEFTRLNQVMAGVKAGFESVASSSSNLRNSMGQIGQGASQASAGVSIFGAKLNEAIQSTRNAENTFKALGPAFAGVSSSVVQLSSGLTPLGGLFTQLANNARATATAITPLGNLFAGMEARLASTAAAATTAGSAFKAGLSTSIASIGGPLNNLNSQLGTTAGGLVNAGSAATQSATGFGRLREMFVGNRGLVFGLSATFGTITGVIFELQLMGDANKQVAESQAVVNELIAAGKQGTGQYQQAVQALGKDQRFLEFATRNLALAFTNFIPDILLVTNGIIQLADKFRTTGAAVAPAAASIVQAGSAMTTTAASTTALGAAQTTLGTSFTSSGNAIKSMIPVFTGIRTEQAGLVLTTNGLAAAQTGMVSKTVLSRDAMRGLQGVLAATKAEELGLIATTDALGNSMFNLGKKSSAAAGGGALGVPGVGGAGAAGGIRGAIAGLLGRLGFAGTLGLAGAIGGGGAAAVTLFYEFALKPGAEATSQRILSENAKILTSYETTSAKVKAGTASMVEAIQLRYTDINKAADGVISKNAELVQKVAPANAPKPVTPGVYNGPNVANQFEDLTPSAFKQPTRPPVTTQSGQQLKAPTKNWMTGEGLTFDEYQEYQSRKTAALYPTPRTQEQLSFGAGGFNAAEQGVFGTGRGGIPGRDTPQQLQSEQAALDYYLNQSNQQQKLLTGLGGVPIPEIQKALPDFAGKGFQGEMTPARLQEIIEKQGEIDAAQQKINKSREAGKSADISDLLHLEVLKGEGAELLKNADAEEQRVTALHGLAEAQNGYNSYIEKQPKILQDTGYYTKVLTDQEQARQNGIRESAGVFIGQANAMKVSLGVAEQVAIIGTKITSGLIEQRDSIEAENLVWENMGTIVAGTNQTMGEWITSQQDVILGSINVTAALTNQTQRQFLVNEGMIAGKLAAQQYLEQTIVGVAQNKQYTDSLQGIITAMGIQLPAGMKLTAQQAELVIHSFEETGSAAGAFAAIINDRIAPAVQRLGSVLEAKNWKEFKDAFKGLEFGDTPDKLVNKFKDFDNMLRKINEDGREMQTVFDHMDIMQSLGKLDVKTFTQGLEAMSKQVDHIGKLQDIDVSNITTFLDAVANTKDPAMLVKYHDIITKIGEYSKNGYSSDELADINNELSKIDPSKLMEVSKHLEEISKNAKEVLKNDWDKFGKFVKSGVITSPDAGYVSPKAPEKPEDKFNSAVDKFSSAVDKFVIPPTVVPPSGAGIPIQSTGGYVSPGMNEFNMGVGNDVVNRYNNARKNPANYPTSQYGTQPGDIYGDVPIPGVDGFGENRNYYGNRPTPVGSGGQVVAGSQAGAYGGPAKPQASATDAFKDQKGALQPMVAQSAEMSKQIQTIYSSMFVAIVGIVTGMSKAITASFAGITTGVAKVVTDMVSAVVILFTGMAKNVQTLVTAMSTNVVKLINVMAVAIGIAFRAVLTAVTISVSTMASQVVALFIAMSKSVVEVNNAMGLGVAEVIEAMNVGVQLSVITMNNQVILVFTTMRDTTLEIVGQMTTDIMVMINNMGVTALASITTMSTSSIEAITTMADTSLEVVVAMGDNVVQVMADMADNTVEIIVAMNDNVVTAIEDMADRGGAAADSFASDMESSMGTVETAASDAASAVSNLADEVASLDGSSAVVTITTNFETTGAPPGQATGLVDYGGVASAASHGAISNAAQGQITTTHGPKMVIYGDNPGGVETHAFIPHDNPFPTLRRLAQLFKGRGGSSEIVGRAMDRAEEITINAQFIIENVMDGQKVGTTIARKVFKKMRTR